MKLAILVMVALIAVSCARRPTEEQIRTANYGPYPSDYESIVYGFMERILKDPDSARYKFRTPVIRGYAGSPSRFGYVVCVEINAKNSFGAYTGYRLQLILINSGQVIYHAEANNLRDINMDEVRSGCIGTHQS